MSRLEELIAELCSDGVEYKTLGEVVVISRGIRVVRSQLSESAEGRYPVFQNSMTPLGYFEKSNCLKDTTFVISAGAAGEIGYSYSAFWAADDCYYFECPESLSSRYLYYALLSQQAVIFSRVRKASIPRLPRAVIDKLKIPLPPLEVQREIVRILDAFTELTAELTAELDARKKQYEYYRDDLLTFGDAVHWKTIGELTHVFSAARVHRNEWTTEGVPFFRSSDVVSLSKGIENPRGKAYISLELYEKLSAKSGKISKGDILITGGGSIGIPYIVPTDDPLYVKDADLICIQKTPLVNTRFLYHYFNSTMFRNYLMGITHDATIAHYTISQIQKTPIPLPPLAEQERIVAILDRFDKLCNDISVGIPAEIEARRKQYEHYRDRLLTFKEKTA